MDLTALEAGFILAIYFIVLFLPALLGVALVECILPRLRKTKRMATWK